MSLKDSLRVMVVDDMSTSRGILTQSLDEIGIKNYMVENNGPVRLPETDPDAGAPGAVGLQHAGHGRLGPAAAPAHPSRDPGVGFILVTGKPTPEIVETGKKLAMNNIIRKPFTVAQMQQAIEQVVGKL